MKLKRDAAVAQAGRGQERSIQPPGAWCQSEIPKGGKPVNAQTFSFQLRKDKLRQVRRREGRYLLRSNLSGRKTRPSSGNFTCN